MLVTVYNTSGVTLDYLPHPFSHVAPLDVGGSMQLPVHPSDWDHKSSTHSPVTAQIEWNQMIQAGKVRLDFSVQTGDKEIEEVAALATILKVYSNANRPAAPSVLVGCMIWNTSDNAPNFSDGLNWRDAVGNLT